MSLTIRADTLTPIPSPYNWPPASKWDGVDGRWSSFAINVGDTGDGSNGQNFRVLISTHGSGIYLPSGDVCSDRKDAAACNQARGIEVYLGVQSDEYTTTQSWNNYGQFTFALDDTVDYGYNDTEAPGGLWGADTVGLGIASGESPMLEGQAIGLLQPKDNGSYFIGVFGLSNLPVGLRSATVQTFLSTFHQNNQIPSLTYGYTAGAYYANGGRGIHGNLVLGGYDASRFNSNRQGSTIIQMPGQGGEDPYLDVGVQSLVVYNGDDPLDDAMSGLNGFMALIDSTTPYLWLPEEVCNKLAELYDLEYNDKTELYTPRDNNGNSQLSLELKIGSSQTSDEFVNIRLPYGALSLDAQWPLVEEDTTFFPLKRSPTSKYVLGRAFLQEAYLIVDYERRNFTVAQAVMAERLPEPSIVSIISEGTLSSLPIASPAPGSSGGLGAGAIAGIVVGAITMLVIVLAVLFFRRRSRMKRQKIEAEKPMAEKDGSDFMNPVHADRPKVDRRASELEDPDSYEKLQQSRSGSANGYYHRARDSQNSIRTELMGSPPPGAEKGDGYFTKPKTVAAPAPLAELAAGDGIAELEASSRPKDHRKRSIGGGSGSNLHSPRSERPDPIAEEHGDHAAEPVVGDAIATPMTEEYKDAREEITAESTSAEEKTAADASESTDGEMKSVEESKSTEQTSLLDNKERATIETSRPAPTS